MKKYIDRKILETLITKYGKSGVISVVNRLNENNENPESGIFIEYHDHLRCDAFRILVLDNGVNVLKNDPLEVEVVSGYTGKRYIAKLEPKYNNDYTEVDFVHSYSGDLCLVKAVKELHAKYSNLPIYCFTEGFYTFRGEYKNVQKFFNDIFSEYLKNLSFEFIPGTMGEFLKNNNMNESLKTDAINETENEFIYQATLCNDWFGSCNNCKLINDQSTIDKWMGKKINDILKTGEVIDDGFSKTAAGPRPDRYEVYEVPKDGQYIKYGSYIIKYSKGNDIGNYYYIPNRVYDILEREFNESNNPSMYDAFGEVIYPGDYVIVVAHNDKYPEGKLLKGTFVKLAANSRLVGVVEIEEYDQKMYKFPKYVKEPQTCIAKYK